MIETVFPFFLILLFGTLLSQFFSKLHVPWVVALIVTGMLLGQSGLGVVSTGPALAMASDFGLIVLMCIAGLEIRTNGIVAKIRELSVPLIVASVIPFVLGAGVVHLLGYDWTASLLVGVVAMSSSVALVAPIIEGRGLAKFPIGQKILTVIVVQDIMSLVGLSLVMRHAHASLILSFPVFLLALAGIILFFFVVRFASCARASPWCSFGVFIYRDTSCSDCFFCRGDVGSYRIRSSDSFQVARPCL
jgi:Kef-type K+ transport system membrane component KefB